MRALRRNSLFIGVLACCSLYFFHTAHQVADANLVERSVNLDASQICPTRCGSFSGNALLDTQRIGVVPHALGQADSIEDAVSQVYLWSWPMVYLHNMRKPLRLIDRPGISGGAPVAPINQLAMLTDYVSPQIRSIPCPNRDVIYGFGMLDLTNEPVVLQVPDFGARFWIYQVGDQRTESFASLGSMYHTSPGFYLIAGPNWKGIAPEGVKATFQSPTNLAYVLPRVFRNESDEDERDLAQSLNTISSYPLSRFNGRTKEHNWKKMKWYPSVGTSSRQQCKWVRPNCFLGDLREVLADCTPLDCEREIYAKAIAILSKSDKDNEFAQSVISQARRTEAEVVTHLFGFSEVGRKLPFHWTTVDNGAAFGSDFMTRTAVAKSNIFINRAVEAKYFYLEHDDHGNQLDTDQSYQLNFAADQIPATDGFWSLTLYDEEHSLHENRWNKYAIGTKSPDLKRNPDGSLTVVIQSQPPTEEMESNWLPSPSQGKFVLYLRVYAPHRSVLDGTWTPPAVTSDASFARLAVLP